MEVAREMAAHVPHWTLLEGKLRREFLMKDFLAAMDFLHRVADVAEAEQHHPDLHVTKWNHVAIEIWTHAVGGLHENDFVLASKVDRIWAGIEGSL